MWNLTSGASGTPLCFPQNQAVGRVLEPSAQHPSVDIYKLEWSLLIEEHMFLLFGAETPPHDVQAPPPLKASIVY